jgi:hypothetical protein
MARRTVGRERSSRLGEGQLVLERVTGLEPAVLDRGRELLAKLVVERHRAAAVDRDRDDLHGPSLWGRTSSSAKGQMS